MILRDIQGVTLKIKMTKELQEFKKRCLELDCNYEIGCSNCPLKNNRGCELHKFRRMVEERFKPKLCPTCGKEIKRQKKHLRF